ncbi:hypothetical protein [Patulibacter sp.]|uniref:hypothetical protein n=1 Tax=Patulibacter sp. TaxID=1912859 RepID=UPI002720A4D6|nr:hypothetical protein [Patulibacter sp.]MDO9410704.1 hypothetical protein [Patulibacter sp.]
MQSAFGIVIFSVVAISGLIAIGTFIFGGAPPHSSIGGNAFTASTGDPGVETPEMREDEVRQMLEARNRRRIARGETPGDIDAEMRDLLSASRRTDVDTEVRAEVEAIVGARQARRRRKGQPEGDFQAEVDELIRSIADA